MSKALDDLDPGFKLVAVELLARLTERLIPVIIVNTRRTVEEHKALLEKIPPASWTLNSKHIVGKAIDICPYQTFLLHGSDKLEWDTNDPIWRQIGETGEALGLLWGGRWKQKDMGHFEQKEQKL